MPDSPNANDIGPLPDPPVAPDELEPHEEVAEGWPDPTDDDPYTLPPEGEPRVPDRRPPTTDPFWEPPIDFGGDDGPSSPTHPPPVGAGGGFPPDPGGFPWQPPGLPFHRPGGPGTQGRIRRRKLARRVWDLLARGVLAKWARLDAKRDEQDPDVYIEATFKAKTIAFGSLSLAVAFQRVMRNDLARAGAAGREDAADLQLRRMARQVGKCDRTMQSFLLAMRPPPGSPASDSTDFDAAWRELQYAEADARAG